MNTLPDNLSGLLSPGAYPHPVTDVQLVETHMSWVLLTGEFAYKIKKPVCYAFVDLRAPERRAFYCGEELRLNRRFARDLSVEVCEVTASNGKARMAGQGEVLEHAVRMRQFDRSAELDRLLRDARIEPAELETFGRRLADIHMKLPAAGDSSSSGRPEATRKVLIDNLDECLQAAKLLNVPQAMEDVHQPFAAAIAAAGPWLEQRWRDGRVRECHGDLHARNIVRHNGELTAFDCLEFDAALRWIDVIDDAAFLLMDLDVRGFPLHAHSFRSGYLAQSGDFEACRMLRLYQVHRALVRAKVAALEAAGATAAGEREKGLREFRSYAGYASRQFGKHKPALLLMHGLSGSGKTWLAKRLAPLADAVHIRSDVERKRLLGMPEHQRTGSGPGQGAYARDVSAGVYERMAELAAHVLAAGYTVLLDATFHRREDRQRFLGLAAEHEAPLRLVHCRAPRDVLERRIDERSRAAEDASEADLAVLRWQESHAQPLAENEGIEVIEADTTRPDIAREVGEAIAAIRTP